MRTENIVKEGKKIFYMDFTAVTTIDEVNRIIVESAEYIRSQPKNSLLTLTSVQGMHFSNEIRELFTNFIKANEVHIKASAVIGLSPLMRIVYNGMIKVTGRNLKTFTTKEEALEYLVKHN